MEGSNKDIIQYLVQKRAIWDKFLNLFLLRFLCTVLNSTLAPQIPLCRGMLGLNPVLWIRDIVVWTGSADLYVPCTSEFGFDQHLISMSYFDLYRLTEGWNILFFSIFFRRAGVCWPLLCKCRIMHLSYNAPLSARTVLWRSLQDPPLRISTVLWCSR